jgi:hypothetical protein
MTIANLNRTDVTEPSRHQAAPFFNPLPATAKARFLVAVFLVFSPLMLLTNSSLAARSWGTMLFWCGASGTIAVLWAASYIVSRRLLAVAIAFNVLAVFLIASRWPAAVAPEAPQPSVFGILAAVLVAGGYVFFVLFVAGEGARTLRMYTELRLARQIHRNLVPPLSLSTDRLEVYGRSDASSEMGGDLIDLVTHGSGVVDVYLADVSGHGVRAGVLMGMVKSALRARLLDDPNDVSSVVGALNRVVAQVKEQDMFVTLACARLEREDLAAAVHCTLAGHLPILHWHAATRSLDCVENDSLPLGVVEDEQFPQRRLACDRGDLLVLYTDGLIECTNAAGEEFGLARFRELVAAGADRPLDELFDAILSRVRSHGPQTDDQTLVLARIK